ncbi:S-adenosyl-methyltransferase MraW [Halobacteroides halobius DSM 5150]|uniref:Ribosomal RNA small subunit methyltransferase H n=1 Tax=Halobacteroides halobius (strain ATCC 35273 / DSM 5150 / MD-1) TaxID=748449 RepID=L0K8V0_HALHC|nr:16S rRNA (cytosine(1402)-N(4))-methyltransferase RsmH [Halobacteroides halobius]AGB41712.1 S-adenosyl-methyltransferase MraW [Halobacteroides halobius DSM 5150]
MEFNHIPVLLDEVLEYLNCKEDGIYVDCTLGGAGHSKEIVKQLDSGKLVGIDQDKAAIEAAWEKLSDYSDKVELVRANYQELNQVLDQLGIDKVDGFLFDLGVSSYQLDNPSRGFSYRYEAPLDMRMDQRQNKTAADIVNDYSKSELTKIIRKYGEEKWANRIAEFIVDYRKQERIKTTTELVKIIKDAIPAPARRKGPHPAKRTFQAIRIAVNNELEIVEEAIQDAIERLNPKGRICVISFHSLEDKIVKHNFKELAIDCICPPKLPICGCDKEAKVKVITKSAISPTKEEISQNRRARSSKLRVAEKI